MKTVDPKTGGDYLGTAAWYEVEAKGVEFPFPKLFGKLGDEYDKRYGLKDEHLAHISAVNYSNGKKNPLAQTRNWYMSEEHANSNGKYNDKIGGRITDGTTPIVRVLCAKYKRGATKYSTGTFSAKMRCTSLNSSRRRSGSTVAACSCMIVSIRISQSVAGVF